MEFEEIEIDRTERRKPDLASRTEVPFSKATPMETAPKYVHCDRRAIVVSCSCKAPGFTGRSSRNHDCIHDPGK